MAKTKHAERVLRNYRNFQKLASLSDKAFSVHGQTLAEEIDRVVNSLTGFEKAILVNQYQTRPKARQSRQQYLLPPQRNKRRCNDCGQMGWGA